MKLTAVTDCALRVLMSLAAPPDGCATDRSGGPWPGGGAGRARGVLPACTARGHTGRPPRADRVDVACYGLVPGAAVLRVLGPLLAPALLRPSAGRGPTASPGEARLAPLRES